MARSRRSSRRGSKSAQVSAIALLSAAVVVVGAFLAWLLLQPRPPALDPDTLCPPTGVVAQTIVLIDTTDAVGKVTRSEVMNKLSDATGSVPKGGLLDIRTLNADAAQVGRLMHMCNPGDGKELDALTANPGMAEKRWKERFAGPMEAKLNEALSGQEQPASPIMAAIQQIAAELRSSEHQKSVPTRVVVVSDMLEHTEFYSHFIDGLDFKTYEAKAGARYLTDLSGAELDYWMVQRNRGDIDPTALGEFWLHWADASGARGHVERLMGMN